MKAAALVVAAALLAPPAHGQSDDPHAHHPSAPATPPAEDATAAVAAGETVQLAIPDVEVLDQEGRRRRFVSDLVAGRMVAIHFIFTNCTTICPPLAATFGTLRRLLGERAGRDVSLISVSVDPTNDTPERLKAWSAKFGGGPGWTLVTGERDQMVRLLKSLGAYTADMNDHPPLVWIGNRQGQWRRAYGLAAPRKLLQAIDDMAGASPAEAGRR